VQQDPAAANAAAAIGSDQVEFLDVDRISNFSGSMTSSKVMRRTHSMNSIATHYFVSQKKLDIASIASDEGGADGSAKEEPEQAVPPRITVHTKMHINAMMCAALIAVLIMSYYSSITTILRLKRWYALTVLLLVPVGAYFFSFAVNTAVCGVFSIFLGEQCAAGRWQAAGN
jgi:putative NIF3 family GTP cyclohydrolase 1 type 2